MAKIEVTMPKMGESITEGTVIEWHKKPGDAIELDESLLEIGTDKVDTDVPSPAAGILAEILVPEGDVVDVGTVIAVIETDASVEPDSIGQKPALETESAAEDEQAEDSAAEPPAVTQETAVTDAAATAFGATVNVVMPKMGESIVEGTVLTWAKSVGDSIELDETLLEIATDKVDTEVPSPAAGTVAEILVPEGDTVQVGTLIAVITTGAVVGVQVTGQKPNAATSEKVSAASPSGASAEGAAHHASAPTEQAAVTADSSSLSGSGGPATSRYLSDGRFLSPLVRAIAEAEGVSLDELGSLAGSGHEGRISKKDILKYVDTRSDTPVKPTPARSTPPAVVQRKLLSADLQQPARTAGDRVEIVKMDRMRQIISEHMIRSLSTSAHVTSFAEVDVSRLVRLRERNKDAFLEREGVKLTYTPFFVFAAVEALREHPILNASVVGTDLHYKKDYHIGIAVAIGKAGLVVPVIRDAGQKNIVGLAHTAADLAARTRNKQLLPDQLQGGTFTVTNVGSLGSIMGTPIINQPQVGILATGAITKRPVVIEDPVLGDTIGIRSIMFVSLSYDHRVVDGAMGSSFLAKFRDVLESLDPNEEMI